MNESISLLMATTILALGGLGLYMFKSSDDENQKGGEEYNESSLFSSNFWGSDSNDNEISCENELDNPLMDEDEDFPRKRSKSKCQTKRQKRTSGTKRRH